MPETGATGATGTVQPNADVRGPEAQTGIEGDKIYKLPPRQHAIMFKALADSDPYFFPKIIAGMIIGFVLGFIVGKVL